MLRRPNTSAKQTHKLRKENEDTSFMNYEAIVWFGSTQLTSNDSRN